MPAVLLDRDGVINAERPGYVTRWEEFCLLPGALRALAALQSAGLRLAVVTNQSMVGRGFVAARALDAIHERMLALCAASGVAIEGVFVCPHAPSEGCECRKPRPGLLRRALATLGERPEDCVAVGDSVEDLLAARAAGVPFVLVRTGRGEATTGHPAYREHPPLFVACDLWGAALRLRSYFQERVAVQSS